MPWTIYCHIHRESGRRYIGLTKQTWKQRWKNHVCAARSSKGGRWHFPNAIRKYGSEAFDHEVLEVCDSLEEANVAEVRWIRHFDSANPEKGFNLEKGGGHTPHPIRKNPWDRPEFREKMEKSVLPKLIAAGLSPSTRARTVATLRTDEFRQKAAERTRDQFSAPESRRKMSETVEALHRDPGTAKKFRRGLETANRNRASKTHCKNGHEFTPENTKVDANGWRYCRRCAADRMSRKAYDARTHCKNGHELTPENVRLGKDGRRRTCTLCLPTHCKNGHELTPESLDVPPARSPEARICRICRRESGRRSDARRRARKRQ
jgi:hypothetical protein